MTPPLRIAVLGSGEGSNFAAILHAIQAGTLNGEIVLALSDDPDSNFIALARHRELPVAVIDCGSHPLRTTDASQQAIHENLIKAHPDVIVLAGFMRILKAPALTAFSDRIINVHPSLLPKFKGRHAVRDALASGERSTGCSVHFVIPEIDAGKVLEQAVVAIHSNDTEATLHARIKQAEHNLLPRVLAAWPR